MGPKLSVSLRVDLFRNVAEDRAMNEFRYAWMRNVHSRAYSVLIESEPGSSLLLLTLFLHANRCPLRSKTLCCVADFPRVDCFQLFLAETIQPHHFGAFAR